MLEKAKHQLYMVCGNKVVTIIIIIKIGIGVMGLHNAYLSLILYCYVEEDTLFCVISFMTMK